MTHSGLSLGLSPLQELQRCSVAKGLMGPHRVADFLPLAQFSIQRRQVQREESYAASSSAVPMIASAPLDVFEELP